MKRDTLRSLLIGSSIVAAALSIFLGVPRLRAWSTPQLQRVWVVSSSLGDDIASAAPKEVLAGAPVTLYAVVEASHRGRRRFFGPVQRMRLGDAGAEVVDVAPWSDWWNTLEILWFKVEPTFGFDNVDFDDDFAADDIAYAETFLLAWGFRDQHAADNTPTGDDFPRVDVGTMRYKATAVIRDLDDRVLGEATSPGLEGVHNAALEQQPHRVTVRVNDTVLGTLQGYAGLPYVPMRAGMAAAQHPATRYLGGTILDFWIAARRRLGDTDMEFWGWQQLENRGEVVVLDMFLGNDGFYYFTDDPMRAVTFEDVRVGDLVAIEDHVGVLYQDRGPGGAGDGVLGGDDRLLGGYFEPLRDMPIGEAFIAGVSVFRFPQAPGR